MHSYWWTGRAGEKGRHFVVGFIDGIGTRTPMQTFELERDALGLVNYLNGGDGDRPPLWLATRINLGET